MTAARRGIVGAAALCALALAFAAAGPAAAPAGASGRASATVSVGYDGFVQTSKGFPVTVEVETDRLVRGAVVVDATTTNGPNAQTRVRLPVEVPGGSAKRFVLAVPAMIDMGAGFVTVDARLVDEDGDTVLQADEVTARSTGDRELVGLLESVRRGADVPGPVSLAIDSGVAQFVAVEDAHLAQAPLALEPLGTLVVGPGDIGRMPADVRRGVLAWLGAGGTLAVDGQPGRVPGLPDGWQPDPSGWGNAGLGRVVHTGGAVVAGNLDELFFPTPIRVGESFVFRGGRGVGATVAADAGLRVPDLGWLLVFLLGYTAVVGPVVAIALNRAGRAELAWVVIPLVAMLFTAGSYVGARSIRSNTRLAHASVIEIDEAGTRTTSFVGVSARRKHETSVALSGATWSASRNTSTFDGMGASDVELTERGPSHDLRLTAGEFAVTTLRGPAALEGALELTATSSDDGRATGSVTNSTTVALGDVIVTIGERATKVGHLEPGESRPWSIADGAVIADRFEPMDLPETRLWGDQNGFVANPGAASDAVNTPAWRAAAPLGGWSRPSGIAVAAGWTRDHRVSVRVGDATRHPVGRTAIATSAPVVPSGRLTNMTVRGEPVYGSPFDGRAFEPNQGNLVRYVLPTGFVPKGKLVASVPAMGARHEVWDAQAAAWRDIPFRDGGRFPGDAGGLRDGPGTVRIEVPHTAIRDGLIFLRVEAAGGVNRASSFTLTEMP